MNVQIFSVILCPVGEFPTKDNCKSLNVVAEDVVDAYKTAFESDDSMKVVSVSYSSDAVLSGTIVDFE